MRFRAFLLCLLLAWPAVPAAADYCSTDTVPAATLLLPYFEVDLNDPTGITTLFSINNARATAGLSQVTLWSDWGVPTLTFNVYLTGYDVQTFNLRDLFNGIVPITASDGQDPTDTVSPQGALSQDVDFTSCSGRLPYPGSGLPAVLTDHLRRSHTGRTSSLSLGCASSTYGDGHARGYLTVDAVRSCSVDFPTDPGYFTEVATRDNRFWGTVTYINPSENSAQQESLVHIEACADAGGGSIPGAELCPGGDQRYTFYGRLVNWDGTDGREPLASVFASSYLDGGSFAGGTELIVWRDTKAAANQSAAINSCGPGIYPTWVPLDEREVVSFDEQENPTGQCLPPNILPPPFAGFCFPFATQKVPVGLGGSMAPGDVILPSAPFGWVQLDLNHGSATSPRGERAQAWVMTVNKAAGRFSTAVDALRLDTACAETLRPTIE